MTASFLPDRTRTMLQGPFGVSFRLSAQIEPAARCRALTASAHWMLDDACQALRVGGLDWQAVALLQHADRFLAAAQWLPPAEDTAHARWGWCRLVCHWLLHGRIDQEAASRQLAQDLMQAPATLARVLPHAVLAGEHWRGLEAYECQYGAFPPDLAQLGTADALGYAWCRHRLYGEYDPPALRAAWARLYAAQAGPWLQQGAGASLAWWGMLAGEQGEGGIEQALSHGDLAAYAPVTLLRLVP